ncbi:MAG: hypothetical protein KAS17_02685 [Victivallaceae bacterium]|nr:hypothetical protein [Victivallaceae bacterium]
MSEKIHVQCYKCKTVYELEYKLRGQLVECAVCDAVFEVPQLGEKYKTKTIDTDVSVENKEQAPPEGEDPNLKTTMGLESALLESHTTKLSTKTIRLPRARCGMLPEVDDKFGAVQAHNPLYHKKERKDPKEALDDFAKSQAKSVKKTPETPSRWWSWGKKKK